MHGPSSTPFRDPFFRMATQGEGGEASGERSEEGMTNEDIIQQVIYTRINEGNTMNPSQIYIAITIVVLAIIALLVFFIHSNKRDKTLTPLAGLAFGFVLAGRFLRVMID